MTDKTGKSILIMEDEDATRSILSEAMKNAGFNVFTSPRVDAQCIDILVNKKIDLMLLDLGLFSFDSAQIIKFLHTQKVAANIPIIIISGKPVAEIEKSAKEIHARDWATKPFKIEEVLAKVHKILG